MGWKSTLAYLRSTCLAHYYIGFRVFWLCGKHHAPPTLKPPPPPPSTLQSGHLSFPDFSKKGDSYFSHKKGGVCKIGRRLFLKWGFYIFSCQLTLFIMIFLCGWAMLVRIFLIYTISTNIFVSWEELSLTESNQYICDLHKWVVA